LSGIGPVSQVVSGTNLGTVHILFTFYRLKGLALTPPSNLIYRLASLTPDYGMRGG
jgi:hypothetical protein